MVTNSGRQVAPGDLERVRELLNTWSIPNDTREPTDEFAAFARESNIATRDRAGLRRLRDDLRPAVERAVPADDPISTWIDRLGVRVVVREGAIVFEHDHGAVGDHLVAVLTAIDNGTWVRLKACPDCRWVFYDHTRNSRKRWCLMNADGSGGRGCGTIAKVRRYRSRQS